MNPNKGKGFIVLDDDFIFFKSNLNNTISWRITSNKKASASSQYHAKR